MMARAILTEDRLELNRLNPIIGGSTVDTLDQVRCAVSFLGQFHLHASTASASPETGVDAHNGAALLCACVETALHFEMEVLTAKHEALKCA